MFFMKKNKDGKSSGLLKNSVLIFAGVFFAILVALVSNYIIIHRWYKAESVKTRQDFFGRIVERIQEEELAIANLSETILSNQVVVSYLNADVLAGRWDRLSDIKQFSADLMKFNSSIKSVSVRNGAGELISMQGTKYAAVPELDYIGTYQIFSNRIDVTDETHPYFYVVVPVYEKIGSKNFSKAGDVDLLLSTDWLRENLSLAASAYSWEDSCLTVLDRNGDILAQSGNPDIYADYIESEKGNGYLAFTDTLAQSEWEISYVTRQSSYMEYVSQVQIVNIATYLVVIAALLFMCVMLYRKVILSIRRQMTFVVNYTKDTSKRLEVWDKTEFGELEHELNEMLDQIETLNREVLTERENRYKLEYAKKQTEMIAYKNQINPHFMYNTLECLRGMALYRGEKEIAKLTEAMSRMFRYNVKGDELVTVKQMLQSIKDYAVIIDYRFMGKITVEINADEDAHPLKLPKMIVQPFVENAVRHGLQPKIEKGRVVLSVSADPESMSIIIADDGMGMSDEELARQQAKVHTGKDNEADWDSREVGIQNVARRLRLFYGDDFSLTFSRNGTAGTKVALVLPRAAVGNDTLGGTGC